MSDDSKSVSEVLPQAGKDLFCPASQKISGLFWIGGILIAAVLAVALISSGL